MSTQCWWLVQLAFCTSNFHITDSTQDRSKCFLKSHIVIDMYYVVRPIMYWTCTDIFLFSLLPKQSTVTTICIGFPLLLGITSILKTIQVYGRLCFYYVQILRLSLWDLSIHGLWDPWGWGSPGTNPSQACKGDCSWPIVLLHCLLLNWSRLGCWED